MIDAVNLGNKKGSSTCVVVTVDKKELKLYGANLGDSGYLIYRFLEDGNPRLLFRSPCQ